ncbi:MAG: DUF177 domain-containing protein [Dehalococcoidia bacterium]|nr:DUF177 domain-containing protein [Dehalococcoidia bacterium]
MQFNVAQLLREPIGASRDYDIDDDIALEEERHRLTGRVELVRTDRGILVQAELTTPAQYECSRCLAPVTGEVRLRLDEEYLPTSAPLTGLPVNEADEPEALLIDEGHTLDLAEAVRQAWLLAEPMKPLCHADCAGLCAVCGNNRNTDPCTCETIDPRWAALEPLRNALRDS